MYKLIQIVVTVFSLHACCFGQAITVRDSGFVIVSNDTSARVKNVGLLSSASQPTINGTWDLSGLMYYYPIGYLERQSPMSGNTFSFATYTYRGANMYGPNLHNINNYYSIDSSGIKFLGQNSFFKQAFSRGSITGNNADSLIFPAQSMVCSPIINQPAFPATFGTAWGGVTSYASQIYIHSVVGNLHNAPLSAVRYMSFRDTVVGWGKMRVRMADSNFVSDYMPVLQVHEEVIVSDSFFMNGIPAPDSVINYLGLAQGQYSSYYTAKFLREAEIEPLLKVGYVNQTYSGAQIGIVSLVRFPASFKLGMKQTPPVHFSLYPNPCKTRVVYVSSDGRFNKEYQYLLSNFSGQSVSYGTLQVNASLHLPQNLPAGLYSLSILGNSGNRETLPLMLE